MLGGGPMQRTMARSGSCLLGGILVVSLVVVGCPGPRETLRTKEAVRPVAQTVPTPTSPSAVDAGGPGAGLGISLVTPWDEARRRRDPSDLCEPVRENLDRAARAIVSADRRREPAASKKAWNRSTPPEFSKLVGARYALTSAEKSMLAKNGFVVPARLTARSYAEAFHDIYQSQLPIYVSADAILHSVFKSNDAVLAETETALLPRLEALLEKMHDTLAKKQADYPAEVARDVDLYLTVARSLLSEESVPSVLGTDKEAEPFITRARAASDGLATVSLFGRSRVIDFSQYAPRGHYASTPELERWFAASLWLSRLEMNLVSRGSRSSQPGATPNPEETPREAVDALAIADLAERAQVLGELDAIEAVWTQFAGRREDVSIRALLALRRQAGIGALTVPGSAEKLKAQIGSGFQRTTRMHYMPQGSTPLPAIATMFGPRVVVDAQAGTELVHAQVDGRDMPSFADVAFMLGHDRANTWLAKDLARFPELGAKLEKGRALIAAAPPTDMYSAWLGAIRGLGSIPPANVPSFMKTDAFRDLRVNGAVAAYGQLRHNYVLVAGQPYSEGGCEVPDGWVEPAVEVYERLAVYAKRGVEAMKTVGGSEESTAYFTRLETTMGVLAAISRDELAGRALSDEEKRWLSMVVEIVPPSSDGPGSFDGWYFDLFPHSHQAFEEHTFIADWFTASNAHAAVYAGASAPRLGIFVVDTGGEARLMVGPVARAYEHVGSLDKRLNDSDAPKLGAVREPWAASYTAPAIAAPPMAVLSFYGADDARSFAVRSTRALGPVTFELLGHHREVIAKAIAVVGPSYTKVTIKQPTEEYGELLRVRFGEFSRELSSGFGDVNEAMGGMVAPEWEAAEALREKLQKRR